MIYDYLIEELTKLLIKQDLKDKKLGKVELISKSGAYKSLIKLVKEMERVGTDIY